MDELCSTFQLGTRERKLKSRCLVAVSPVTMNMGSYCLFKTKLNLLCSASFAPFHAVFFKLNVHCPVCAFSRLPFVVSWIRVTGRNQVRVLVELWSILITETYRAIAESFIFHLLIFLGFGGRRGKMGTFCPFPRVSVSSVAQERNGGHRGWLC